mgnify:CR=1 FL=1
MKNFKQKVVVITGAASGMGRAYALAFAKEGSLLALCDFDEQGLKDTQVLVANITDAKTCSKIFDISDEEATFDFAAQVKSELGNAHVVINNAGIEGSTKPVWASDADSFKRVMNVNYFGVVNGTRAFLPQLQEDNRGVIVNVSSIFGLAGTPNHADYCGSKFAVRGFTEALMVELKSSKIQVHLLHPGGIKTNIARKENSRAFSERFLTTSADDIAQYLIKGIQKNKLRIVYGNGALKTFLGARFLPLAIIRSLIWNEMKPTIDMQDY